MICINQLSQTRMCNYTKILTNTLHQTSLVIQYRTNIIQVAKHTLLFCKRSSIRFLLLPNVRALILFVCTSMQTVDPSSFCKGASPPVAVSTALSAKLIVLPVSLCRACGASPAARSSLFLQQLCIVQIRQVTCRKHALWRSILGRRFD